MKLSASLIFVFFLFTGIYVNAQIAINTDGDPPAQSAMLDIESSTSGLLIPRLTIDERDNISSPAEGLLIYQTDGETGFYYYSGTSWMFLTDEIHSAKKIDDLTDAKSDSDGTNDGSSVFLGLEAGLQDDGTDNQNIGFGYRSLYSNTSGSRNTAIGYQALLSNQANSASVAVGYGAMRNANDDSYGDFTYNTAIGYESLLGSPTPSDNTGSRNTAVGYQTLYSNTSGGYNTATGNSTLYRNTTGRWNTAVGYTALYYNDDGDYNTATGYQALFKNTSGENNTVAGAQAQYSNTTGNLNTAVGQKALYSNTTGEKNTSCGGRALYSNETGSNNTAVGYDANFSADNLNNTTAIGYGAGGESNVDNRIEIGNTSVSWIGGEVTWSTYSDRRIKKDVEENVAGLDFINRLRPVTYHLDIHRQNQMIKRGRNDKEETEWNSKYDIEQIRMTGFIAQEVEQAAREAGYDFSGVQKAGDELGMYSVRYAEFVVPLVKAVQEQQSQIQTQQQIIKQQQKRIDDLQKQIDELKTQINGQNK